MAGEWQQFATMNSRRYGAAGIVLRNSLMIFGGYETHGSGRLQSTEIINQDGQVSQGPVMPIAIYYHANAAVNASTLIISGGSTNTFNQSPLTWYYNHVTQKFQPGPSLMKGREEHTSGTVVDKETNENIVVVAGGYNNDDVFDSTELLINGEWQQGTNHANHEKWLSTTIIFANKVAVQQKRVGSTPFWELHTQSLMLLVRCVLVCSVGFIVDCYDRLLL